MCIDAPESTTNSFSSGFNVDAGRHLFSGDEKNAALWCSFNFLHTFGQLPRCFAGTLLLPFCLFLWTILKFWSVGATLMRFTWSNVTERGILVSNFGMTRNSLLELYTLDRLRHVSALLENRLRRRHFLKYATQLSCIRWSTLRRFSFQLFVTSLIRLLWPIVTLVGNGSSSLPIFLFQYSHSAFVIIRFGPFRRLCVNLTMCEWALLTKTATIFVLVEQAFWRMPFFTEWVIANSCEVILARPSRHSTTGTWASGTSGSRWFSLTLLHERILRRIWWCNFSHAYPYRGGNCNCLLSHFASWFPIANNLQEFFVRAVLFLDSWPRRSSHNFRFWTQNSHFEFLVRFSLPKFSICDNQVLTFSDESPGHTIPIRSWVFQTLVFWTCTIFPRCHHAGFSSWTIIFRPTLNRIPEYRHFVEQ